MKKVHGIGQRFDSDEAQATPIIEAYTKGASAFCHS